MQNLEWKAETGWTWTGGSTTSKYTWTEIWGDGEGAAIKDDAAEVSKLNYPHFNSNILINGLSKSIINFIIRMILLQT